jgi:DNA-binding CsgD family transcriptional regulator
LQPLAPIPKGPVGRNRNTQRKYEKDFAIEDEPEMCRNLTTILRLEKFHPLPKTNGESTTILGNSESTVKKHVFESFDKLGVETRTAASLRGILLHRRLEGLQCEGNNSGLTQTSGVT